jgi:hypothetical protein
MVQFKTDTVSELWKRLDFFRQRKMLTWYQMASQLNVRTSTLIRLAQGVEPDSDTEQILLAWLQLEYNLITEDAVKCHIPQNLRDRINSNSDDLLALRTIINAAYVRMNYGYDCTEVG